MKVLVIGGTLFIGKLLVEELLKEGHDVAVLHRKPKHDFGRKVENLMADRNDAAARAIVRFERRFVVSEARYRRNVMRCTACGPETPARSAQVANERTSRRYATTVAGATAVSDAANSSIAQGIRPR